MYIDISLSYILTLVLYSYTTPLYIYPLETFALPLSHNSPVHPSPQLQRPVALSQRPPFSHLHFSLQPRPKVPAGHSTEYNYLN